MGTGISAGSGLAFWLLHIDLLGVLLAPVCYALILVVIPPAEAFGRGLARSIDRMFEKRGDNEFRP